MTLLNQIPKLGKIPQILNKKREAEKESKKRKKEQEEQEFPLKNKNAFKKGPPPAKIKKKETGEYESKPKSARDGIGRNIDLKI